MSEVLSIVVMLVLVAGLYKMFGHYIAGVLVFAALGAIIGAIFTDGMWETYARWGGIIGFAISFIVCFQEAWRTFLGSAIGGLIGAGIGYFIPENSTMWEADLILGLVLLGGAVASSKAAEDLFEETVYRNKGNTYKDALGREHTEHPYLEYHCETCEYYQAGRTPSCIRHPDTGVYGGDRACDDYK